MTATTIDLSWVTFTDDETSERCEYLMGKCTAQAAYAVTWQLLKICTHRRKLYCADHAVAVLRKTRLANGLFRCRRCGERSRIRFMRIDPL